MKKKLKTYLSILSIPVIALSISTSTSAATDVVSLGVSNVSQAASNWCWAASSVSVLDYYDISATQHDFVETVKGDYINEGATLNEIESGLDSYNLSSSVYSGSFTFSKVMSEIGSDDDPIIAGIKWTSGGGHAVVIDGYEDGSTDYIEYMDPWDGEHVSMKYSSFKSNSNQTWFGSVYNFSN